MSGAGFDLARYLDAKYPGHLRTDTQDRQEWAAATASNAFPGFRTTLEYFFIRSRRRHCAKFEAAGRGGIIMDDGLSSLLAVGDLLLLDASTETGASDAFVGFQFAEAFHQEADAKRTLVAAAAAVRQPSHIRDWRHRVASSSSRSAVELFLLLHEVGHLAVDNRHPFVDGPTKDVRRMLDSLVRENEKFAVRLRSGEDLSELDTSIHTGPSAERDTMLAQILSYVDLIRADGELIREASCDFVALMGLVELRIADGSIDEARTVSRVTYRELGDALLIALRTSRLLVAQEMIRSSAENIVSGGDPSALARSFARLTARSTIVANLATQFFDGLVKSSRFDMSHASKDQREGFDPTQLFSAGVKMVHDRSVERIFNSIERFGQFFLDDGIYSRAAAELMRKQFGHGEPSLDEVETLACRLIAAPPI